MSRSTRYDEILRTSNIDIGAQMKKRNNPAWMPQFDEEFDDAAPVAEKKVREKFTPEELLRTWLESDESGGVWKRRWVLDKLRAKSKQESLAAKYYLNVLGFLFAILVFVWMLAAQRQAGNAHQITRLLREHLPLKTDGQHSNIMPGWDAVLDYLDRWVEAIWIDPTCGDLLCEGAPREFASWGPPDPLTGELRHGCAADCGQEANLTNVHLLLSYDNASYEELINRARTPASTLPFPAPVRWNVCTEMHLGTFGLNHEWCWFEGDGVELLPNQTTTVQHIPLM
eukprot:1188432-Prorocentrum_minimum.AAC.3